MHSTSRRSIRTWIVAQATLAAIVTALAVPSSSRAVPVFEASTQLAFNGVAFDRQSNQGSINAGAQSRFDDNVFHVHARGTALASASGLRASGFGQLIDEQINISIGGQGTASARFDDFIISGPPGPVTASFDLVISGSMSARSHPPSTPGSQTQASSFVVVQTAVDGLIVTADPFFQDRVRLFSLNGGPIATQATGMLADWPADPGEFGILRFTTPGFTVNANQSFQLDLTLIASAGVFEFMQLQGSLSEANSDFGSTLAFPTFGPVFNLPAGYTVDSLDAHIRNNQFVDGGPTTPVPEPSSLALLLAAAAALAALRGHLSGARHA
jgi:hypothetical protein